MSKTKKGGRRRRSAAADRKAAERAEDTRQALQYRRLGYSHAKIDETMGISQSTSHRWVSAALKEIPREAADEVSGMMLDRLDRALQPLMRAIEEDAADSSTVSAMLAIEDRRARLLGIYELARFSDSGEDLGSLAGLNTELTRLRILADRPTVILQPGDPIPAGQRYLISEPGPANPRL